MANPQDISLDQLRNMLRGNEKRQYTPTKGVQLYSPKSQVEQYDSLATGGYDQNQVSKKSGFTNRVGSTAEGSLQLGVQKLANPG